MYLLDTNIISEMMKPPARRHGAVIEWLRSFPTRELYTSAINLAEISYGAQLTATERRSELLRQLALLEEAFKDRILGFSKSTAHYYGLAAAQRSAARRARPNLDTLIAAIALENKFVVITRNVSDFEETGVEIINPFEF